MPRGRSATQHSAIHLPLKVHLPAVKPVSQDYDLGQSIHHFPSYARPTPTHPNPLPPSCPCAERYRLVISVCRTQKGEGRDLCQNVFREKTKKKKREGRSVRISSPLHPPLPPPPSPLPPEAAGRPGWVRDTGTINGAPALIPSFCSATLAPVGARRSVAQRVPGPTDLPRHAGR